MKIVRKNPKRSACLSQAGVMHMARFYMEKALEKLAEQILSFDEASLAHLREKYRSRI